MKVGLQPAQWCGGGIGRYVEIVPAAVTGQFLFKEAPHPLQQVETGGVDQEPE